MTTKTKTMAALLMVVVLSLGIFTGSLMNGHERALAEDTPEKRTVSVQGEGVVTVTPDIALITLGVETSNKEMGIAQEQNKVKMNDIINALKAQGIAEKDIQTQNYSVYPDYQWENNSSVLKGYRVSNQVRVKVRKIDNTGRILDAIAAKGANIVNGIQFTIEDSGKAYEQALEAALENAQNKAKVMVGYFDIKNITPVTITEGSSGYYAPIYRDVKDEMADAATPVMSGEMEIRASVSVTFEY